MPNHFITQSVSVRKQHGQTYTPSSLALFAAKQILLHYKINIEKQTSIDVLDPAIGNGVLIENVLNQLPLSVRRKIHVYGYDIDSQAIIESKTKLQHRYPEVRFTLKEKDFIEEQLEKSCSQLPLFSCKESNEQFDIIIANPPYVRIQLLKKNYNIQALIDEFDLHGRFDLYHIFIVAIKKLLKPFGMAGVITSNRFMTTKSGQAIREFLINHTDIIEMWDLGDTRLFDAAVLPAILVFSGNDIFKKERTIPFTSIYENDKLKPKIQHGDLFEALTQSCSYINEQGRVFEIVKGECLLTPNNLTEWVSLDKDKQKWKQIVEAHTWKTFDDIGFIKVGVKTCADKIFIRESWKDLQGIEQEGLILPLITHKNASQFCSQSHIPLKKILYPYFLSSDKRDVVTLDKFPITKKYLEGNRSFLEKRTYLMDSGRYWFELWVPQQPSQWSQKKIIFRDISDKPEFWMDDSGGIVNGDCYWMTAKTGDESLLWLALGVANSSFIELFYDNFFNNKLYAGRRRYMAQYVKRFPLPNLNTSEATQIIKISKQLFISKNNNDCVELKEELNKVVFKAFGL